MTQIRHQHAAHTSGRAAGSGNCQPIAAPVLRGAIVGALLLVACVSTVSAAEESNIPGDSLTITLENDTFTGSDNNYTNGLGFSWQTAELGQYPEDGFVAKWGKAWSFLPFVGDEGYHTYAAWTLAQEMHTPDDIENPNPPKDDEPYAGVLYVDSVIYALKERWAHAWELKLGVVGPGSFAHETQREFHQAIGSEEPMGWETQLPSEPIVNVGYTVAHEFKRGRFGESSAEWRVVPAANVALGNYFTGAGVGAYGEIGWNLVNALGGTSLRAGLNTASTVGVGPVDGWSVSLFCGAAGYGVAHYLPLDGTVFKDSRSVDTKPFVGTGTIGMSLRHHGFVMSLSTTYHTDTFETQRKNTEFGTLAVSWLF